MLHTSKPYFIAETAFHHEGDIAFLKKLVSDLSRLDVDALKFHLLFDLDDYMVKNHPAIQTLKSLSIP